MEEKRKDPKEKKCAICGKDMYAGEDWVFKRKIGGERTKWFCSYKCMRAWDAKHEPKQKRPAGLPEDLEAPAPKEPTSRAVLAKALMKEIQNGGSVIAYLTAEGYKNPYEAYASVRHYCETKMPELAEVLKPLRELQKAPAKTGRPEKYPAKVEKVDKVPEVEPVEREDDLPPWERQLLEMDKQKPVQSIAHVTDAELEEAEQAVADLILQGGVNYQLKIDEDMKKPKKLFSVLAVETEFGQFLKVEGSDNEIMWDSEEQVGNGGGFVRLTTERWMKLAELLPELMKVLGD